MQPWDEVINYWFGEISPENWFASDPAIDAAIGTRFRELHARLSTATPDEWRASTRGTLAAILVLDQFSRNLFRDDARAYAQDPSARALAFDALEQNMDRGLTEPERQFLHMPLMHSERLADVERCAARWMRSKIPSRPSSRDATSKLSAGSAAILHAMSRSDGRARRRRRRSYRIRRWAFDLNRALGTDAPPPTETDMVVNRRAVLSSPNAEASASTTRLDSSRVSLDCFRANC